MTKKILVVILILFITTVGLTIKKHIDSNGTYFLYKETLEVFENQYGSLKIIPMDASVLESVPSFSSHQNCVVIREREEYKQYKKEFTENFCQRCEEIQFTKHMLIGMPYENVITSPDAKEGVEKYAFLDHENNTLHFYILPEQYKQFHIDPWLLFRNYAQAAYLAPDNNWLVRIPKIPDGYAIECKELDRETLLNQKTSL